MKNKHRHNATCEDCGKKLKNHYALRCGSCASKKRTENPVDCGKYVDGHSLKKYFCTDCKVPIPWQTAINGNYRCRSCANKGDRNPMANRKGKDSPNYNEDAECHKKYYCSDCRKEITLNSESGRCKSCATKERFKNPENHPMYGKRGNLCASFGKIHHGKGSYYKNIYMRSSWEIKFAKWLDKLSVTWLYESKTFDLGSTTYTPDFYLPEFNLYIEVKGWWRDDAKVKFEEFKQKYCGERIKIVDKTELQTIGVLK